MTTSEPRSEADVLALLTERAAEIARRNAAVQKHLRGQDGRLEQDFSDRVAYTEGDEVLEELDEAGRAELTMLNAAITRLGNGTWGACIACGQDIEAGRLHAIPETPYCLQHADRGIP